MSQLVYMPHAVLYLAIPGQYVAFTVVPMPNPQEKMMFPVLVFLIEVRGRKHYMYSAEHPASSKASNESNFSCVSSIVHVVPNRPVHDRFCTRTMRVLTVCWIRPRQRATDVTMASTTIYIVV